jgi:hypothetical protein
MGFLSDLIHGKEKTYKADPLAGDLNSAAKSGMGMLSGGANSLNEKFYKNPDNYIDNQIGMENNLLRNASQDATRRTRQLIAQRGMGSSSIGLGQEVNQARGLNERLAMNNASGMERLRGLLGDQMKTGQQLMAPRMAQGPVQMNDITARSGGYGQLIGAGLGAAGMMMGGPAGGAAASGGFNLLTKKSAPNAYENYA